MIPKCRIIPAHASCRLWTVKLRHLIEDFSIVFESQKTMRASLRNIHRLPILCCQHHSEPISKSRRRRTEIQVRHRRWRPWCSGPTLSPHAAQPESASREEFPSHVKRNVALDQFRIEPVSFELIMAPGARKESTFVHVRLDLNLENAWQLGFTKEHERTDA